MNLEIIDKPITFKLHGFSGTAANKDYAVTAFKLMDRMWKIVKTNNLENKGLNIWVYDRNETVFAGVELTDSPNPDAGLEQNNITIPKYARYIHIGPYHLIRNSVQKITEELKGMGLETRLPYIEIYGHFTNDESKLETELIWSIV